MGCHLWDHTESDMTEATEQQQQQCCYWPSLVAQVVNNLPAVWDTWVQSLCWEGPLEWAWQPTSVFLPGEFQGRGSLVGCRLWGRTESDMTEVT